MFGATLITTLLATACATQDAAFVRPADSIQFTPSGVARSRETPRQAPIKSFAYPMAASEPVIYFSDDGANAIWGFNRTGRSVLTIFGSGVNLPAGMFVDKRGRLWVANYGGEDVLIFPKGATNPIKAINDRNQEPVDVAVCPNGFVYVSNREFLGPGGVPKGPGSISVYAPGAKDPTTMLQTPHEEYNWMLTCDSNNNVFTVVQEGGTRPVYEYVGGVQGGLVELPISASLPAGIRIDKAGNLLLNDQGAQTITEYTEAGMPTGRSFSTTGLLGPMANVYGIAMSRDDDIVYGATSNYALGQSWRFPSGKIGHSFIIPAPPSIGTQLFDVAIDPGQNGN